MKSRLEVKIPCKKRLQGSWAITSPKAQPGWDNSRMASNCRTTAWITLDSAQRSPTHRSATQGKAQIRNWSKLPRKTEGGKMVRNRIRSKQWPTKIMLLIRISIQMVIQIPLTTFARVTWLQGWTRVGSEIPLWTIATSTQTLQPELLEVTKGSRKQAFSKETLNRRPQT